MILVGFVILWLVGLALLLSALYFHCVARNMVSQYQVVFRMFASRINTKQLSLEIQKGLYAKVVVSIWPLKQSFTKLDFPFYPNSVQKTVIDTISKLLRFIGNVPRRNTKPGAATSPSSETAIGQIDDPAWVEQWLEWASAILYLQANVPHLSESLISEYINESAKNSIIGCLYRGHKITGIIVPRIGAEITQQMRCFQSNPGSSIVFPLRPAIVSGEKFLVIAEVLGRQ